MGALLRMREAFSRLFRTGTHGLADPRRAKRIMLANQIACSLAALCFVHVFIDRAMGAELLGWLNIPNGLVFLGILLLNRVGRSWAARITLICYAALYILLYAAAMGKATGMHLFFLPACWAPLVLFGWDEKKSLLFGVVLNSALLVACEIWGSGGGLLYSLDPEVAGRMHSDTVITTLVIQILIAAYFTVGNHRAESALGEAMEAARSADRSKTRFLANMSHEIRTPLNGVIGIAHLLSKAGLPPENREMARTIESSSLELMSILNEILDHSKIEAGMMELERRPFDLEAAIEATLKPFEYEARRMGLYLGLERDPAVPSWVSGDSVRFKQVLRNLIGNAIKFTAEGGVTVRIRPGARPDWLEFEVEDSGPGIPADARGRIFVSFSQADDSTTRKYGGTGLGLAISKQIVELMGGTIGFRDRSAKGPKGGPGTIFHFTAPFPASAAPAAPSGSPGRGPDRHPPEALRESFAERAAGLRCLIVDDHPVNRKVLARMLEEFGLRPDSAPGGREALEAWADRPYDLVFTDCHMPGMDGMELARRLRKGVPAGRPSALIVGVTADIMPGTRERCLEAGMDEVLPKPVFEADLARVLSDRLGMAPPVPEAPMDAPVAEADWTWVDQGRVRKILTSLAGRDPERRKRMLASLREDLEAQIQAARSALGREDRSAGREAVHGLKGLCLTMCLTRMAESCLVLERDLSGDAPMDWSTRLGPLEAALEPSMRELNLIAEELGRARPSLRA